MVADSQLRLSLKADPKRTNTSYEPLQIQTNTITISSEFTMKDP